VQTVLAEFDKRLDKFDQRAKALSVEALQDVERDNDERAAMTLLVSGALELFLREVTRDYVGTVSARGAAFNTLPKALRRSHYEDGAHYLLKAAREDWANIKDGRASDFVVAADVCRRLHSVSGTGYELVWEAFARTDSNADPETIKKMLDRLDVDSPWATIEASIPTGVHPLPPGSVRANKLNADIRNLRDARNRCAHGAAASPPGWSLLLEYIASLKAIAVGIVEALKARLSVMPS
jgi:hypothetical protein